MFEYANVLATSLAKKVLGCITDWWMLITARKTLIQKYMTEEQLRAEIENNETKIAKFFEELPAEIEKIEIAEKKETDMEKWKAAWEREEKAKLRATVEKEPQDANS